MPSNCGLFSPHQVDMNDYMKVNSYDYHELANMNIDVANSHKNINKKELNVEILIDIFSSSKPLERKPLNLCFAFDRSASMEENNRMEKLKDAMKEILSYLIPGDYLSIVTYGDVAQVLLPSRQYDEKSDSIFRATIDQITIGGGTNMLDGMLRGYCEINKNQNRLYCNRLILMSDGVSTTGEKDPEKILKHTIDYYNKGIETSTIGIGNNINFNLLHNISIEGRGKSYFVGDCDSAYIDIDYVLKEEFNNMNANMENVHIEISNPKYFKIADVYGASKVLVTRDKLFIQCPNLSQKNQFILIKYQSKKKRNRKDILTVNLSFTENNERKNIVKQVAYVKNIVSSEKIAMANKIVDAVNCVKSRLINHQYDIDCLDRFVRESNVPDNIVLLRKLIR
jgi:Mg-chelatase subunit ChlD/glycerol-3-phosphate cytidylyltransferase-like family protein